MKVRKISYIIINVQMTKITKFKKILNDLDNGDASLLNDESTNDSEEVVTEQSNNDEASSKLIKHYTVSKIIMILKVK